MATCINYVLHVYVSNLTTGMDRPHQNTHSIKKLANYMVGKGVKCNDVIFHIVHIIFFSFFDSRHVTQ